MITTSCIASELSLGTAFPLPVEADPERDCYEPKIKPKRRSVNVYLIEKKLMPPRDVSSGINLSDPGQTWSHAMSHVESRDVPERDQLAVPVNLDFLCRKRPRAHEAHISLENVP